MFSKPIPTNRTFLVAGSFIAVALVLLTPTFLVNKALAAPRQFAVAGTGSLTCSNGGGTFNGAQIFIPSVSPGPTGNPVLKQNGQLTGEWTINAPPPFTTFATFGGITGGKSSMNTFTLTGVESNDDICGLDGTDQDFPVTISGQCGQGVTIQFVSTADGGQTGMFRGNVACV